MVAGLTFAVMQRAANTIHECDKCLECCKKMRTLKAHLRKTHKLLPKEYFQRYGLDPKKFPLVCKEYSEQRRKLATEGGLGSFRRKTAKPA